jgi:hypothetical protein
VEAGWGVAASGQRGRAAVPGRGLQSDWVREGGWRRLRIMVWCEGLDAEHCNHHRVVPMEGANLRRRDEDHRAKLRATNGLGGWSGVEIRTATLIHSSRPG